MILRLVDFGLVVLIWLTQSVIYPSFTYYSAQNLVVWHSKYTTAITFVVMPLMLSQAALHVADLITDFDWLRLMAFLLVVCAWINTFLVAVPLHKKISEGHDVTLHAQRLVAINWYRVIFWTLVAVLGCIRPLKMGSLLF